MAGIHCYLGLHVVDRGVIFVDLALAQVAALGATAAVLFGQDLHGPQARLMSLGLTVVAAALFALGRFRERVVPQEAMIGIAYAVSAALAILLLDRAPHGEEEVKSILVGHLLFVTAADAGRLLALSAGVGTFHYLFRRRFLLVSRAPEQARAEGVNLLLWDFLFYVSFAAVITSAVRIAGVLLVFAYLVVPAVGAMLLSRRTRHRLVLGWTIGLLGSVLGLSASAGWDLPTGPAVVVAFGTLLAVVMALRPALVAAGIVRPDTA
jgi:zinc/manganese transport system permease protein